MIQVLENPLTDNYKKFKDLSLSGEIFWNYLKGSTFSKFAGHIDMPFYSHMLLGRPEVFGYSKKTSPHFELAKDVILEILDHNNLDKIKFLLRACLNCVHPTFEIKKSQPHEDHTFPHKNFIAYFTDSGGKTFVENEHHDPKEDDVLLFDGIHYMETPKDDRRIVLIATMN
tara:strand:+ start:43 stop:555 length:513 start_codon:yes stop_codon:yes gene_type:complete